MLAWIITLRGWPPTGRSASTCSSAPSTSYTSFGVYWKWQTISPVFGRIAITLDV